MKTLWLTLVVFLIASQGLSVDDNAPDRPNEVSPAACEAVVGDANDPNGLWKKWDAVVKDPNDPNELLLKKWDAVISVLQIKDMPQKTKETIISKIITPIFDFPLMAKLVLGRKHWPKFTPPQREKFTKLFTERLKNSYREKLSLYTDEQAYLKPATRKKTGIYIPMEMISKGKKIAIIYKLRKVLETWKIYDVEIQGVSILLTYRSQFDDILRRSEPEDLLARLAKPPAP
ncbi:MAG: ABC transporter substrate-binding protein [Phycisphaerae bacterium]|nr:ABC transporter substrate-binding protein [Phycisphaerae bacterium]